VKKRESLYVCGSLFSHLFIIQPTHTHTHTHTPKQKQLSCVIYLFSKHVHDPTLPLATQTLSVRVILHLVDSICKGATSEEGAKQGRRLLFWILKTLVLKFGALRYVCM
jgi:hypothetical protein